MARRAKSGTVPTTKQPAGGPSPREHNKTKWIAGIAAVVLGSVLIAAITWIASQVFDPRAAGDKVRTSARGDSDIRWTAQHMDEGYELALPQGTSITDRQRQFLNSFKFDFDKPNPTGYNLDTLVHDLRAAGAANPGLLRLRLTLEGRRNQEIHIDDIRPADLRRAPTYNGTLLSIPPQGAGQTIQMMFDLDQTTPDARTAIPRKNGDTDHRIYPGDNRPGEPYFLAHTLSLPDADTVTLVIDAIATRSASTFVIDLAYHIGTEAKHLTITDEGRHFALTPVNCADHSVLSSDRSEMISQGHVSYDEIWYNDNFQRIAKVTKPNVYELGMPYC